MTYDRDPQYLHPYITARLQTILDAINYKLPASHTAKLISAHRTPADQFEIFKKGRTFKNGAWVKTGNVFTYKDGYIKLSRTSCFMASLIFMLLLTLKFYLKAH